MYTVLLLIQNTCKEEKFLQVHGGLHFGKILKGIITILAAPSTSPQELPTRRLRVHSGARGNICLPSPNICVQL